MIKFTFKSPEFSEAVTRRHVAKGFKDGEFRWCAQSIEKPQFDYAQGTCEASDLPPHILAACLAHKGVFYACEWPW